MGLGWFGSWFGATSSGGGGGGISFPPIATVTTREAIRDRVITVIEDSEPLHQIGQGFRPYRNEGNAEFSAWCEQTPGSALRRFQVRDAGDEASPDVSNTDFERRIVTFQILIAYPQTSRYGGNAALDRDDFSDEDYGVINNAIGWVGKPNFTAPTGPDATPLGAVKEERVTGKACDFLVITASFLYHRNILG